MDVNEAADMVAIGVGRPCVRCPQNSAALCVCVWDTRFRGVFLGEACSRTKSADFSPHDATLMPRYHHKKTRRGQMKESELC
jgi:hypothetical protein